MGEVSPLLFQFLYQSLKLDGEDMDMGDDEEEDESESNEEKSDEEEELEIAKPVKRNTSKAKETDMSQDRSKFLHKKGK